MKKTIVSLFCVLALCLGLLPTTALAAGEGAPDTLWVGETQITASGYWITDAMANCPLATRTTIMSLLRQRYPDTEGCDDPGQG